MKLDDVLLCRVAGRRADLRNPQSPRVLGEPAIPSVGAVIASAIFDATGALLRVMPMTAERVKDAIVNAIRKG